MSRIKGRYVAKIILDIDAERTEDMASFEEIKKDLEQGDFTTVEVIEQFSDVNEVEEDNG